MADNRSKGHGRHEYIKHTAKLSSLTTGHSSRLSQRRTPVLADFYMIFKFLPELTLGSMYGTVRIALPCLGHT
jgi:hypothetical protein